MKKEGAEAEKEEVQGLEEAIVPDILPEGHMEVKEEMMDRKTIPEGWKLQIELGEVQTPIILPGGWMDMKEEMIYRETIPEGWKIRICTPDKVQEGPEGKKENPPEEWTRAVQEGLGQDMILPEDRRMV